MKNMGEASYVIGIKIHRNKAKKNLGLSQKIYIKKLLERFKINDCFIAVSIVKGDKFSLNQYLWNILEQ